MFGLMLYIVRNSGGSAKSNELHEFSVQQNGQLVKPPVGFDLPLCNSGTPIEATQIASEEQMQQYLITPAALARAVEKTARIAFLEACANHKITGIKLPRHQVCPKDHK